jgi:hypothetical protein
MEKPCGGLAMSTRKKWMAAILLACSAVGLAGPSSAQAQLWEKTTSVERLAKHLDQLERQINSYGSVIAKQPDVWGQARLTRHRFEFEQQMRSQLGEFKSNLNASISRSDQAFLLSATALGAATGTGTLPSNEALNNQFNNFNTVVSEQPATPTATGQVTSKTGTVGYTAFSNLPARISPESSKKMQVSLEPTIYLDQMARYLNHLQELRRISEGDDTADSPGYSMNLVRVPVSVLPGSKTRTGYGAEITFTATPYLSEELLPQFFRNLVINDLVDLLGVAVAKTSEIMYLEMLSEEAKQIGDTDSNRNKNAERSLQPIQMPEAPVKVKTQSPQREYQKQMWESAYMSFTGLTLNPGAEVTMQANVDKATKNPVGKTPNSNRFRRSRSPLPPSQVNDVVGNDEMIKLAGMVLVAQAEKMRGMKTSHANLLDIRGWLKEELDAAYDALTLPENVHLWESSDLPALCRLNNNSLLTQRRQAFFLDQLEGEEPQGVLNTLGFMIVLEAALLNERLIADMRQVAADKGCACLPAADGLQFHYPNPSPEERSLFNEYVRCRWPIHVFALDPMTQDQNVADAFSRRRELQLALAIAFTNGRLNANNLTRYARRLELDMETIALNRTALGFSHGEDTFGWRFYPRVQTPPERGNLTVAFHELLVGGPTRDDDLRQRQLEPGMRECVAVVIMPSFVPYVTLESHSRWFPTTGCCTPRKTEPSAHEAAKLSKLVRTMEDLAEACVHDEHRYRQGDVGRLLQRTQQLAARLPMQSQMVQIPYENTLGGFELFSDGTNDLAPELVGFYGEPGIDPSRETRMFLVGDHFSIHDTRVIAGTLPVEFDLISRQVMEVRIPAGVRVTRHRKLKAQQAANTGDQKSLPGGDGVLQYVDVHIATPYGTSSHLEVPVYRPDESDETGAADEVGVVDDFTWGTTDTFVQINYKEDANGDRTFHSLQRGLPNRLEIAAPKGTLPLPPTELQFSMVTNGGIVVLPAPIKLEKVPFDARRGCYVIRGDAFDTLFSLANMTAVFTSLQQGGLQPTDEFRVVASFVVTTAMPFPPDIAGELSVTVRLEKK